MNKNTNFELNMFGCPISVLNSLEYMESGIIEKDQRNSLFRFSSGLDTHDEILMNSVNSSFGVWTNKVRIAISCFYPFCYISGAYMTKLFLI